MKDIEQETGFLQETAGSNPVDPRTVKAMKYSLIVIVEAMLQICQHILARKYRVAVSGYRDAFKKAGKYGIIREDLSRGLQPIAELRNEFLIHGYWRCDDDFAKGQSQGFS